MLLISEFTICICFYSVWAHANKISILFIPTHEISFLSTLTIMILLFQKLYV